MRKKQQYHYKTLKSPVRGKGDYEIVTQLSQYILQVDKLPVKNGVHVLFYMLLVH